MWGGGFSVFGDAVWKIQGEAKKGREIYFALYQALAEDEARPGLYKEYPPDYFDLIIVDECHRGSAADESRWRSILEYFHPATQIGMTATPLREETRDTYRYFGNPIYTYRLGQGIEDGFLAPYRVHRVVPSVDATGWRPEQGQLDRFGREIPDGVYETKDFERVVSLLTRTEVVAQHLTSYLKKTDRFAKTMVFCVDQEHAEDMRAALHNANEDLTRQYPHYVARVTAEEGKVGRGHVSWGRSAVIKVIFRALSAPSRSRTNCQWPCDGGRSAVRPASPTSGIPEVPNWCREGGPGPWKLRSRWNGFGRPGWTRVGGRPGRGQGPAREAGPPHARPPGDRFATNVDVGKRTGSSCPDVTGCPPRPFSRRSRRARKLRRPLAREPGCGR